MPIRTTVSQEPTSSGMAITNLYTNAKEGKPGTLVYIVTKCKLVKPLWKTVWRVLKKLKIDGHTIRQAHSWADSQRREAQSVRASCVHCCSIHNSQGLQSAKVSSDRQTNNVWQSYGMESYSAVKGNEIRSFVATWMDIKRNKPCSERQVLL